MNLWRYDLTSKKYEQLTKFKDDDIHYPSMGPDDIVYEAGGKLYLFNLSSQKQKEIKVHLVTDRTAVKPKIEPVENLVQFMSMSPDGNRVAFQARGEIFSVPAENGFVKDMTRTSGAAERFPTWSPLIKQPVRVRLLLLMMCIQYQVMVLLCLQQVIP